MKKYVNGSKYMIFKGEPAKIWNVYENNKKIYTIHRNPFCNGTWFFSSKAFGVSLVDLRTDNLETAKERAERQYSELTA